MNSVKPVFPVQSRSLLQTTRLHTRSSSTHCGGGRALGPRGWHCTSVSSGVSGSCGRSLTPEPRLTGTHPNTARAALGQDRSPGLLLPKPAFSYEKCR